jgi:ketosteroid isomerase-like protein
MNASDRAIAERAFDAFRRGLGGDKSAVDEFCSVLADDVKMHFPMGLSKTKHLYEGHEGARAVFQSVFDRVPKGLEVFPAKVLEGEHERAVLFADRGQVHSGDWYKNAINFVVEVRGGKVTRTWEFIGGPHYFLGDGIDPSAGI